MEHLNSPQGTFTLQRYPRNRRETLRAWDAADELLLAEVAQRSTAYNAGEILILNDSFGALGCALAALHPQWQSDSELAHRGLAANLTDNGLSLSAMQSLSSMDNPRAPIRLLLIKLPKIHALLEHQLRSLRPLLTEDAEVIAAGMLKGINPGHFELLEQIIGTTHTSLAKKKARLIFARPDPTLPQRPSPYPSRYRLENSNIELLNHANLFSRDKLDIGTRILLGALPQSADYRNILDLACGNGVIGIMAAKANPKAKLWFRDESHMAVASAEANFRACFGDNRSADFAAADCAVDIPANSVDLVLNNPPFHQQSAVGDQVAKRMFRHAHSALRTGGELWVIGNRHLNYHITLKKQFGNCRVVTSDRKFVLLASGKH